MSKVQLSGLVVLTILLMRLAAGFHFYTEGVKKLEPGFSSQGFLRNANGPLADYFHSLAPGLHGAYALLDQPRQLAADAGVGSGVGEQEVGAEPEEESPFPPRAPYHDWAVAIDKAWQLQHDAAMAAVAAGNEVRSDADKIYRQAQASLGAYLADYEEDIAEYQHELWRLGQLKKGYEQKQGTLPYLDSRIADKKREVRSTPNQWIAGVKAIEDDFHKQIAALGSKEQQQQLAKALNPPTQLDRINLMVTGVVLGAGVCLFLGLFTRLAAVMAAGFLMSVIATQPPWVYGSDTTYLGYQLFEIAGLLMLAAVGAGRWLGVDALLGSLFGRRHVQTKDA